MIYLTSKDITKTLPSCSGATLAQNLFAAGLYRGYSLCAGLGRCGRCKVRYQSDLPLPDAREQEIFSPRQLDKGWRLGCRHYPEGDVYIEVPAEVVRPVCYRPSFLTDKDGFSLLAVDIGTTAIKWQGILTGASEPVSGRLLNPQMGSGADVMARMAFAQVDPTFASSLQQCLLDVLLDMTGNSSSLSLVVTGNSVMMYSLLGRSFQGLAASPYMLEYQGNATEMLGAGKSGAGLKAYIPPLLAPFVGADIACGLCHLLLHDIDDDSFPSILADFGTNGEFVLALSRERYLITSVAMGPALEGVGLTRGTMAGARVCTGFTMSPKGLTPFPGDADRGVSGTGYLSLIAALKRIGVLDVAGQFTSSSHPMARSLEGCFETCTTGKMLKMNEKPLLTGQDVEEILKLKASCNHALETLFEQGGITPGGVKRVFIAGSLGTHLRPLDLVELGFVPRLWEKKMVMMGNTALAGAWDLLTHKSAHSIISGLEGHVKSVDLPGQQDFTTGYVSRMRFAYC